MRKCENKGRANYYQSSGVGRTKNGVFKKKWSCVAAASAIISRISQDLLFCLQHKKRSSPLGCTPKRKYWVLQAIAVARLMLFVRDWFICTPAFSCCTDEISSRVLINSSPTLHWCDKWNWYNQTGFKHSTFSLH